jgi:MFS transporter, DHA1 family, inner membrane transport protein
MPRLLYFLSLCNLTIGSSAFVLGSIVTEVATGLNVSTASAGQAMTAYALATAILAPIMLMIAAKWPRHWALFFAMALVAFGGALCAFAPNVTMLYVGRVVMGVGAVFTPMAAGIAIMSVPAQERGKALSITFLGMSLSYVIGIPLGAWVAAHYGWRVTLGVFAVAVAVMALLCAFVVPKNLATPPAAMKGVGPLLKRSDVLAVLGITLLYFIAIFAVFSYIAPVLKSLVSLTPNALSLTLTIFGVSGVIGTLVGGWANDRFGATRTIRVQLITMGAMMILLPLTKGNHPLMIAVLFAWGVAGFGMMPPQQARLAALDFSQAPLLLSLNTSMLYFGTALGAIVGGIASRAVGFDRISQVGSVFVLIALLVLLFGPRAQTKI